MNRVTLEITTDNSHILSYLNNYDIPNLNVKEVSFGRTFGNGYLLIHYEDGTSISTNIYEGETEKEKLSSYIKSNGYSEREVVLPIVVASLVVIIVFIILLLYFVIKK